MSDSIDRNAICTVKLKAEQWEVVLQSLGKTSYELAAPIIQSIIPQIMEHTQKSDGLMTQ
jgi:hypothetical protein